MPEELVGFDVREMCFPPEMWPQNRRALYLIAPSAQKPMSVDTFVWPSIFDTGQAAGSYDEMRRRVGLGVPSLPDWLGPNTGLWDNVAAMRDYLGAQLEIAVCRFQVIAISLACCLPVGRDEPPFSLCPFRPGNDWAPLGYDVADSYMISGLSNCAYTIEENAHLAPAWAGRLNSNHLFDDTRDADDFRQITDMRVPEHAPFRVYGLWRSLQIDGIEGGTPS
jgi:hypothetical protein